MDNEKAIIISLNPQWYYWISEGSKTLELRKSRPKLKTPFKVYVYLTKFHLPRNLGWGGKPADCGGHVVGEFICDSITKYQYGIGYDENYASLHLMLSGKFKDAKEIYDYGRGKTLYGWHISKLKVYDKPKKLSDFYKICDGLYDCGMCWDCEYAIGEEHDCGKNGKTFLSKPPQSWEYIDGVEK